ncbi:helix-turn-helix domain-containing protein [Variovorax paradoxus]|nr:XRE family transcriptional regulator [Variovorax paradoxus]
MTKNQNESTSSTGSLQLGARVRQLRRVKGLTVDSLARATGVDKAHLSRIENNVKTPSIAMLAQLAQELGTTMGHLLGETLDESEIRITRAADLEAADDKNDAHRFLPLLHGGSVGSFEAFLFYPGKDANEVEGRHAGQEMLFIVSGSVELIFRTQSFQLQKGDCVQFPGYLAHRLRRVGRAQAVALLVLSNE